MSEDKRDPEDMLRDAVSLMRRAYYSDISSYAEDIGYEIKRGNIPDMDALDERIRETADGSQWVIYTWKAQAVAMCSDNNEAGFTDGVLDPSRWTDGLDWSAIAYYAMEQDLRDAMSNVEGIDLDSDNLLPPTDG